MAICPRRCHATAARALHIALLYQIRLDHVLDGLALFADRGGEVIDAYRSAREFFNDGLQQFAIHHIQAARIHIQHHERCVGHFACDMATRFDLRKVAHATQQSVGDTWRAARTLRHFNRSGTVHVHAEQIRRARHDARKLFVAIKLQARDDAESIAQRVGQHARARRRSHERKRRQIQLHRTRARSLADHDVDGVVFHRAVERFLEHRTDAMNLVDEQHVVGFKIREQRRQIALLFQHRAGCLVQRHAHLARDDVRKRCLA